jgi:uncharacterized circularly permuted ATP-grasp superfamily protein/uncharacterized alpha-E superfamily protein
MTLAEIGREGASGIVDGYRINYLHEQARRAVRSGDDELLDPDGVIRPSWQGLAATLDLLGAEGMQARADQVRRLLEDDGVTYGTASDYGTAPDHGTASDDGSASHGRTVSGGGTASDGGAVSDGGAAPGSWQLDPLPVILGSQEWAELSPGLIQRAELLDRLLADLYGPRDLLRRGLIPPEVVLGHAGFIRACDGIRLPGPSQLVMASTDLVRRPDGWCALGDRTQAPSGAGYAMQNRRIVSRVMPGLYRDTLLERLRSFFHALRAALQQVAPATAELPRVVILTPGAASETSFDQAFLSTLLGFPLVEGQDLTVREGRVWIRSLGRPEPVDVILRRVDGWFCDPLELRADSRLGVPGLLQAARMGNVSIVNPPGSGVLENPGLVPFLPAICADLLDAPLLLGSVPTWWCGDRAGESHVLANLGSLVIRPIARGMGRANRFGWELSRAELAGLAARIQAEPYAWCAQEALEMSTAPVITSAGLEPRSMVLRSFAVAERGSFRLMAGGLARVSAQVGSLDVSSLGGALAKDVWVLGVRPPTPTTPAALAAPASPATLAAPATPDELAAPAALAATATAAAGELAVDEAPTGDETDPIVAPIAMALSSRVAEDMFWLGRYAERAEDAARLLRVVVDLAVDHSRRPGSVGADSLAVMLRALTEITTTHPGFVGAGADERLAGPQPELIRLAVDAFLPGTLAHAVRHTTESAHAVRELLSADTWLVLGSLDRVLVDLGRSAEPDLHLQAALSRVLEGLLALSGLAMESMIRDSGWYLMDAGRRIERAIQTTSLLRHTLTAARRPAAVDDLVMESVLISAESVITYRRRNPGRPRVDDVLALLLFDAGNPRGVRHQLDRLADDLNQLPQPADPPHTPTAGALDPPQQADPPSRPVDPPSRLVDPPSRLGVVQALLRDAETRNLARAPRPLLAALLDRLFFELTELADAVAQTHFARVIAPQPMPSTPTVDVR